MSAKFQVDAVFSIEGRGTVMQGTILSGEVSDRMLLRIPGAQGHRRVAAVEGMHGDRIPTGSVGLVLDGSVQDDVRELAAMLEGKVLNLE